MSSEILLLFFSVSDLVSNGLVWVPPTGVSLFIDLIDLSYQPYQAQEASSSKHGTPAKA